MAKYDLVSQEDKWGCGAACVASLLDISYAKAKKLVEREKGCSVNAKPRGLELHHIALALKKHVKVVADWSPDEIHDGSIVCISGSAPYDGDHYILKTPHGWMDPWYNLDENTMEAKYRKRLPKGTSFLVALVAVSPEHFIQAVAT